VAEEAELARPGEPPHELQLVLSGELGLYEGEEPFDTHVATLRSGDCYGAAALLDGRPGRHTLRALTPSIVLCLGEPAFRRLVMAVPEVRELVSRGRATPHRDGDTPLVL
jgi:CRP-like cAMP-binding protein